MCVCVSPILSYPSYLPCLLTAVLSNCRCYTWAGELLSVVARMQVALLSRYTCCAVHRATHSAVVRGLSTGPQDCTATANFSYHIGPNLPITLLCAIATTLKGIHWHAKWRGHKYSSWSLPLHLRSGNTSGAWCSDCTALIEHSHTLHQKLQPSLCVCELVVTLVSCQCFLPTSPDMRAEQGLMSSGCSGRVRAAT